MFEFDEKMFCHPHPDHGHFPPEKKRYTMTEEMEHTTREMRECIARLYDFEKRLGEKVDDIIKNITSDNVIFKNTFSESHRTFLEAVKNEVNSFEGNTDSAIRLFMDEIKSDYATLSEDCAGQIQQYYNEFVDSLASYRAELNETYDTFRDAIESRLEQHNFSYIQAFTDYTTSINSKIAVAENNLQKSYSAFTIAVNKSINDFKIAWTEQIDARLDGQDSVISDTVLYIKSNLAEYLEDVIQRMETTGEVSDIVNNIISSKLSTHVDVENTRQNDEPVMDLRHFAGQGTNSNVYACVVHNYTDSPSMRLDHVGTGSILQLVNARNPTHRSDQNADFHGTANPIYYMVQNDSNGDGSTESYPLFWMDKNGAMYWNGWTCEDAGDSVKGNPVKFITNKDDAGTYGFVFECAKDVHNVMNVMSGGKSVMQVLKTAGANNGEVVFKGGMLIRSDEYLNLISDSNMVIQVADSDQNAIRFRVGGTYYYPQFTNKFCVSTDRPTQNVCAGEIYMETDTDRTIRRNSKNTGWVDMNGNPV